MNNIKSHLPVLWLAGLGIVSGFLSAYPPLIAENVKALDVPIYQGLLFGLVIGFGVYRWGNAGWIKVLLVLVVTTAAWIAAVRGFYWVTDDARTNLYFGGLMAGAIGATGTIIGVAFIIQTLRNLRSWILTVFVGAVAGLLVVTETQSSEEHLLLLFVVWQAAVSASIGDALIRNATGR